MDTCSTFLPPMEYTTHYDLPYQARSDLEITSVDIPKINGVDAMTDYKKYISANFWSKYTTDLSYLRTTQQWIQTIAKDTTYDIIRPEIVRTLPTATRSWDYIQDKHHGVLAKSPSLNEPNTLGQSPLEPMSTLQIQRQMTDQVKHLVNQIMVQPTLVFIGLCVGFLFTFSTGCQFPISVLWVGLSIFFYKLDLSEFLGDHYCGMVFSKIFAPKHWIFWFIGIGHLLLLVAGSIGQCMNIYNTWVCTTDSIRWANDLYRYLVPTANHMTHIWCNQCYEIYNISHAHKQFLDRVRLERDVLEKIIAKLDRFVWLEKASFFTRVYYSGEIWSQLYQIADDPVYQRAINYSFGWNGYVYHLWNIGICKHMKPATFTVEDNHSVGDHHSVEDNHSDGDRYTKLQLIHQTYPHLYSNSSDEFETVNSDETKPEIEPTKNTVCLDKNIILTGPNASGKTTVLKMTMMNLIFNQQYGYGFYDECIMPYVYKHFCFYLNIPDTNGRDSLFQAEARRCSEIATKASECTRKNEHMFCIFDELFSGTNPEDATDASVAFIRHLTNNHPTTDFMLTTHYIAVCDQFLDSTEQKDNHENKKVELLTMEVRTPVVNESDSKHTHYNSTYQVIPGVGRQRGAFGILEKMFSDTPDPIFT